MIKRLFRPLLRLFCRYGPQGLVLSWARRSQRLYLLPPGRTFRFRGYLGDLTILADPLYWVELEMLKGYYDLASVAVIDKFIKAGDVCLDVGANVGALTLAMGKRVGQNGRVFGFEPGPPTFRRLQTNISLNPSLKNVIVPIQLGLSDVPSKLYWNEDANNPGNAQLLSDSGSSVQVTTVDDYFADPKLSRLDFVKIDVEGMECEVLKGGIRTWERFHPVLFFETLSAFERQRHKPLFAEIEAVLGSIGYSLFKVREGKIAATTSANLDDNTLALHPLSGRYTPS